MREYDSYLPNEGLLALTEIDRLAMLRSIITQNIAGLHRKAGSKSVIEIHGPLREIFCVKCGREYQAPNIPEGNPPFCQLLSNIWNMCSFAVWPEMPDCKNAGQARPAIAFMTTIEQ